MSFELLLNAVHELSEVGANFKDYSAFLMLEKSGDNSENLVLGRRSQRAPNSMP